MKARPLLIALLAVAAYAGDEQFNGRWDIEVTNEPRRRAWWLEVEGAGTPHMKGKFVTAYAGDMNVIDEMSVTGGELKFSFKKNNNVYTARLEGGKLKGTFQPGGGGRKMDWTGVRAPVIKDKDDGSWKPGKPVELFNGKDMTGWSGLVPGKELGWTVKDGILASTGGANNLISTARFWNYLLHIEYRVGAHSNSGVGLRGRYEIQILEDHGKPPNTHSNGALYSRIAPSVNASRPAGEWQTYDIRLVGRQVTVTLNGRTIIDKGEIEGLTAVAADSHEAEPGPFILQGDHGPVDFRKVTVTPLVKK